ncbi:GNAT family N-acetyltransferase [Clostridium chauvoei]|uniref:GNAT family N-acetyltransferase n=2 Tax=Clostridium chauvoei TaxID=46867 RepID=A0ABD4RFE7_9CLOT|nr:GNAT family N-acetyltransferase [Clostridium chauvoei]ATD55673.1 GNAT family N-acetyltransferase [Clostridium chauvoei]ATD56650.1 GNAT family N-acetyltransferase [Clostridium chauvoei]MBX7280087.1 GNAT family N-acetyltransferase [Clostridium chauvoei]MBX7282571.1 GNAT family N-acetyltransferase [Clostridium chauvoei]MBX7284978.1 GNAT family N-acetyltransferase [Clostridium chauvoei]
MKYYKTNIENLKLRETTIEDIPLILSLIKEIAEYEKMSHEVIATEETLKKSIFENNRAEVLIGELEGKVIGYVSYFYNFSTFVGREGLYLEDIFIKPEFRGKGIGKELFKVLGKLAKENGCKRMEWTCLNWNKPSINFYKSLGAIAMDEWTTYRLRESEIDNLSI